MKEYTVLAVLAAAGAAFVDRLLGTRLLVRRSYWLFVGVMMIFLLLVNGYLTWRPIVLYGERFYLGWRIGTIPIEDFFFGFSMMTLNVILWEYFKSTGRKGRMDGR